MLRRTLVVVVIITLVMSACYDSLLGLARDGLLRDKDPSSRVRLCRRRTGNARAVSPHVIDRHQPSISDDDEDR